ncbi:MULTISPECIES: hypothetical protein [Xanthomonas translucens group]|uniref:Uncharacterized protein n=1 Tax=Xanthomonas cerealis pv. cerealis TaxID=152263 RepID=A0A514EHX2_9XANT|nr:hypothetical protein [Xanthomonas translucens]QDI05413.1 hypothetical protein E4A48_18585 [Xanthomonas translucens pv. cerealis]UKE47444.1 hypothetical protein KHA79_01525 [Xanthomonas translucens pv. cerealis]UKE69795.1 hypothetical protein K8O61_01525 [Xanthomonas translucens pv. pistacia]
MAAGQLAENSLVAMAAIGNADAAHMDVTVVADSMREALQFSEICAGAAPARCRQRPENVDNAYLRTRRRRCHILTAATSRS